MFRFPTSSNAMLANFRLSAFFDSKKTLLGRTFANIGQHCTTCGGASEHRDPIGPRWGVCSRIVYLLAIEWVVKRAVKRGNRRDGAALDRSCSFDDLRFGKDRTIQTQACKHTHTHML